MSVFTAGYHCMLTVCQSMQHVEIYSPCREKPTVSVIITLGAHAQRGYGSWVCLHFSNVRLSHKRYDLHNGQ